MEVTIGFLLTLMSKYLLSNITLHFWFNTSKYKTDHFAYQQHLDYVDPEMV